MTKQVEKPVLVTDEKGDCTDKKWFTYLRSKNRWLDSIERDQRNYNRSPDDSRPYLRSRRDYESRSERAWHGQLHSRPTG